MKASFNGMRKNATANMNKLHSVLKEVLSDMDNDSLENEIIEAFNNSAQSVDVMNCLYDPNVKDDMDDLSDFISVNRLIFSDEKE